MLIKVNVTVADLEGEPVKDNYTVSYFARGLGRSSMTCIWCMYGRDFLNDRRQQSATNGAGGGGR